MCQALFSLLGTQLVTCYQEASTDPATPTRGPFSTCFPTISSASPFTQGPNCLETVTLALFSRGRAQSHQLQLTGFA